jgi:hypothetical protein
MKGTILLRSREQIVVTEGAEFGSSALATSEVLQVENGCA